jgi:hypothetical protein
MLDVENKIPQNGIFSRFIYWKLITYSTIEVWRDDVWWNDNIHKYYEIWHKVEYHRKNGYHELLPKRRPKNEKNDEIIIDMNDCSD